MSDRDIPPYIGGFEILGEIGRGGMGVVYRARDPALQRDLAIKLQSGNWNEHPDEMERFLREARILARINHPNVVQIYSVGTHDGAPFFAMELLERSVADAARLRLPQPATLKRWMLDAARGLAAIHEMGVVHRDIKPANLLLTTPTSVESEHVKIADLGIASANELFGGRLTQAGMVLGTSGYLAPEAWHADAVLDGRADQYALGVVYFELLAGRSPHRFDSDIEALEHMRTAPEAPDVRTFRPDVDEATATLIARLLRPDPAARFPDTPALVQALLETIPAGAADYRVPTPRPFPVPAAQPQVDPARTRLYEAPTLARPGARRPSRRQAAIAILLPIIVLLPLIAWYVLRTMSPDAPEPPTADRPTAALGAPTPESTRKARSAWADYLLGHYTLQPESGGASWTLSLLRHEDGILRAELTGLEAKPIKLRGEVDSQADEIRGDSTWTVSRVHLDGPGTLNVVAHIAFDAESTEGTVLVQHGARIDRLTIIDGEDL